MRGAHHVAAHVAAIVLVAGGVALLGEALVALRVARDVVTPPRRRKEDVAIIGVDRAAGTVRLGRTPDTIVPGHYSLWFDHDRGHARVGAIVEHDEVSVLRRLEGVQRGDLGRASRGRWAGWWYLTPSDLEVPFREVGIETPVGVAPAWLIKPEGASDAWAVIVHGRGVTRAEGLRAVSVFRGAGYHCLLISYRNDGDAPPSHDGRYALGDEEWRDVEAAVAYARSAGARRIVLMGWSMGGATVLQCITRSPLATSVNGVVLESPVVDWIPTLRFQAAAAGLPPAVRDAALAMLGSGRASSWVGLAEPIDFDRLDIVARAAELSIPMLLLHSVDDGYVPSGASIALAAARPDVVRLERFAIARHTKLWNYDPRRWERAIRVWLAAQGLDGAMVAASTARTARPRRPRAGAASPAE
ncbi:MAG: alpha/beta hydrolase [Microbacteriaceae bacterium]|nr:alpha/beta hydrolase [Microbacteriaceae bacterium]